VLRGSHRRLLSTLIALGGCGGSVIQTVPIRFADSAPIQIDGLTPCTSKSTEPVGVDPSAPLVLLVHGCNDSAARFTTLAKVFEAHGQQAICFSYESRDTIDVGARRLARSLAQLERWAPGQPITIIGHSQGGLVSRRAMTATMGGEATLNGDYELVTLSSPFAGIEVARHCSMKWLHGLSFGITAGICRAIAGRSWREIHAQATLVKEPGRLRSEVTDHLQVRTDERETCRVRAASGKCEEDDFVFSLDEQDNPQTLGARVRAREVAAGHIEIVGGPGVVPTLLIGLLQEEGILKPTPPAQQAELALLLERLYAPERTLDEADAQNSVALLPATRTVGAPVR